MYREIWSTFFHENGIEFAFYSANNPEQIGVKPLDLIGREQLIDLFDEKIKMFTAAKQKCDAFDGKDAIFNVGLVGYPNVGKSSTINSLLDEKKTAVASTPGKTKHLQTHFLREDLCLVDCPGLVFPNFASTKAELVVNGILPIDQLREHIEPCSLVAHRIPRAVIQSLYGINLPPPGENQDPLRSPTASELLSSYALARGFMTSSQGNPNESRAARYILKDYVRGRLLYIHPPPTYQGKAEEFNTRILIPDIGVLDLEHAGRTLGSGPLSQSDISFFTQNQIKACTKGRFGNSDYTGRPTSVPGQKHHRNKRV